MSQNERQALWWWILGTFALLFAGLLLIYGCAPLSPTQRASGEGRFETQVAAVEAAINSTVASTVNDLWPIVTLVLGGASVATAGVLTGLGIWWYRRRKNGNARREELIRCIEEASR